MRKFGFLLTGALFFMATIALVEGQQPGKKGGFGGFGGGGANNPFFLLQRDEVKKDLDVTDEQMEKLPAEMLTAISRVLNEKQFSRFKQISLQQKRNNAFKEAAVQKQLNLTADQKKSIDSIIEDETKELVELFKGGGKGGFKGNTEKTDKIRAEAKEKIYTVLNKDQRKTWRELIGTELKLTTFGGFGGGNKGKKKKTNQ